MNGLQSLHGLVFRRKLWLDRWNKRDKYYEYSDDAKAYNRGKQEYHLLLKEDLLLREEEMAVGIMTDYTREEWL